jgi:hypothetical protein
VRYHERRAAERLARGDAAAPAASGVSYRLTNRTLALGGGAVLLFGVGTSVQAGWVLAIAALLLGMLVVGVVLPIRGLVGIEVARDVPASAVAGERVPITVRVTNRSRHARGLVRVRDDFCGPGTAVIGVLLPGQTREYASDRNGARRGVHAGGTCKLDTGVPFGAARVRRTDAVDSRIVVYPRTYAAPPLKLRGASGAHAPASMGDVSSVREYRPGDPLRHVHWRSVARRGELMVREFDIERNVQMSVAAEVGKDAGVSDAIASVACSLAMSALRDGGVELIGSSSGRQRATTSVDVLEWGARLTADDGVPFADVATPAAACVAPADTGAIDVLCALAADTSLVVVLVGDGPTYAASRLRAAGASVVHLTEDQVEPWFANGCAVA